MSACRAVSEGHARHVIIYRTIQMLGGTVPVKQDENAPAPPLARMFDTPEGETPPVVGPMDDVNDLVAAQAYSAANWLALHCRRHMELYGTTKEQLGWLALNSRRNAALNPRAVYRDPMTMADYLGARPVSHAVRAAGLRRPDRRIDRGGGVGSRTMPATARTGR